MSYKYYITHKKLLTPFQSDMTKVNNMWFSSTANLVTALTDSYDLLEQG